MRDNRLAIVALTATFVLVTMPMAVARPLEGNLTGNLSPLAISPAAAPPPTTPEKPTLPETLPPTTIAPIVPVTTPAPQRPDTVPVPQVPEKPAAPETPNKPETPGVPDKAEAPKAPAKPAASTPANPATQLPPTEPDDSPRNAGGGPPVDDESPGPARSEVGSDDSGITAPLDKGSLAPQMQLRSSAAIAVAEQANFLRTVRELEPAEGLSVAFTTLVENIALYWQAGVATGAVASVLLWLGISREQRARFSMASRLRRLRGLSGRSSVPPTPD